MINLGFLIVRVTLLSMQILSAADRPTLILQFKVVHLQIFWTNHLSWSKWWKVLNLTHLWPSNLLLTKYEQMFAMFKTVVLIKVMVWVKQIYIQYYYRYDTLIFPKGYKIHWKNENPKVYRNINISRGQFFSFLNTNIKYNTDPLI